VRRKKTTRAERELRRAEARQQDRRRKEVERRIDLVERGIDLNAIKIIPWEEATIRVLCGEQLPDDALVEAPLTPAEKFLMSRLRNVPVEQFDDALKKALSELMASDMPMSAHERQWYGDGLRWLKSRRRSAKIKPLVRAQVYEWVIDALVRRGYTADKAKDEVIKAYDLGISIDSLDRFILRHLKKKGVPAKTVG
jgi:hypothetical protein